MTAGHDELRAHSPRLGNGAGAIWGAVAPIDGSAARSTGGTAVPFQCTTEAETKPVPLTVSAKELAPSATEVGLRVVMEGTGFPTPTPVVVTVTVVAPMGVVKERVPWALEVSVVSTWPLT